MLWKRDSRCEFSVTPKPGAAWNFLGTDLCGSWSCSTYLSTLSRPDETTPSSESTSSSKGSHECSIRFTADTARVVKMLLPTRKESSATCRQMVRCGFCRSRTSSLNEQQFFLEKGVQSQSLPLPNFSFFRWEANSNACCQTFYARASVIDPGPRAACNIWTHGASCLSKCNRSRSESSLQLFSLFPRLVRSVIDPGPRAACNSISAEACQWLSVIDPGPRAACNLGRMGDRCPKV